MSSAVETQESKTPTLDEVIRAHDYTNLAKLYGPIASYDEARFVAAVPTVISEIIHQTVKGMEWEDAIRQVIGSPGGDLAASLDQFLSAFNQTFLALQQRTKGRVDMQGVERRPIEKQREIDGCYRLLMYHLIGELHQKSQD